MTWTDWTYVAQYELTEGVIGIHAKRDIPADTLIGIYGGEVIALEITGDRLVDISAHRDLVQIFRSSTKLFGLVTKNLSGIDYINHSCNPNVRPLDRIVLITARDVSQGEALTLDYRRWDFVPEGIRCWCEEAKCAL